MIHWNVSREDHATIIDIVKRYATLLPEVNRLELNMDITAVHANGCPLKLKELLTAPEFDFVHDIAGIRRHINRQTGQLEDCFLPRYAEPNPQAVGTDQLNVRNSHTFTEREHMEETNMAKELTPEELQEANDALELVADTQTAYWNALSKLEGLLDLDLDGTRDYQGMTVDDLLEEEDDGDTDDEASA